MILVACCPPGNISNILTHRAGGNVALSVSMTAISNVLSIVLMPLNFAFWGGLHPTGAAAAAKTSTLDPVEMVLHIVLIIGVPFVLGITVARAAGRASPTASRIVGAAVSFLALVGFIVGGDRRQLALSSSTTSAWCCWRCSLHDALAFGTGYGIAPR